MEKISDVGWNGLLLDKKKNERKVGVEFHEVEMWYNE